MKHLYDIDKQCHNILLHLVMNSFIFRIISMYYGSQSLIFVSAMAAFLWPICILYKLSMNLFYLFTNQIFHFISNISTELWKWFDFSSHLPLLFFFQTVIVTNDNFLFNANKDMNIHVFTQNINSLSKYRIIEMSGKITFSFNSLSNNTTCLH